MPDLSSLHSILTYYSTCYSSTRSIHLLQRTIAFFDFKVLSYTTSKMVDRTTWGEKAHLDLLLSVFNHVTISKSDWDGKILPELRAKGYTFNVSAVLYALSFHLIHQTLPPTSKSSPTQHILLHPPAPPPPLHLDISNTFLNKIHLLQSSQQTLSPLS